MKIFSLFTFKIKSFSSSTTLKKEQAEFCYSRISTKKLFIFQIYEATLGKAITQLMNNLKSRVKADKFYFKKS
ncbi:hypothetical protein AT246_05455 [Bartonella henselae]|nr:hypothetical protein BhenCHDE101_05470 [Bartonella henselae]PNM38690.1 hypothetical protein AL470_004720 [Bartonella henselae str. Houston-1]OLL38557.1 hypothetical protein AT237_02260 [Bartonella henselae]OLL41949.1 hypothetical protein AT244_04010 [Bartonella henselae]OLL45513.1 hypothetical protein AT242_00050 [Bartonella henselae]